MRRDRYLLGINIMDGFKGAGPTAAIFGSTDQQETLVAKYTRGGAGSTRHEVRIGFLFEIMRAIRRVNIASTRTPIHPYLCCLDKFFKLFLTHSIAINFRAFWIAVVWMRPFPAYALEGNSLFVLDIRLRRGAARIV